MKIHYGTDERAIHLHQCFLTADDGVVLVYGGVYAMGSGDTPQEAKADLQRHINYHMDLEYRAGMQMLNLVTQSKP